MFSFKDITQVIKDNIINYEVAETEVMKYDKEGNAKGKERVLYYNTPVAFDIETTNTYIDGKKFAFMYVWQMSINGAIIIGRTWDEFAHCIYELERVLELSFNKRLIVWVHNLAFEFQFIRKYLKWESVFSLDTRKPVKALTDNGIEFRCTAILSGKSLDGVAKDLHEFKINKLKGELDYSLVRTHLTELTDKEIAYCINDVQIIVAYIYEKMEEDGDITKICLTKTGYVRRACRDYCFSHNRGYHDNIAALRINGAHEYLTLKAAFQGGFTHASPWNALKNQYNVASFDLTSSYPTVMLAEKFPMSTGRKITIHSQKQFEMYLSSGCCVFTVEFTNISAAFLGDYYISYSKCTNEKGERLNPRTGECNVFNGRISRAKKLITTITNIDWEIINMTYNFDSFKISDFYYYKKDYLPKEIIECILKFYKGKTELKGVAGKEKEYAYLKELLNSIYGMIVTDIIQAEEIYDNDEWQPPKPPDISETIGMYNRNKNRFLFYPWGVFVTAYARRNLWSAILETGADHVYSDTDSEKFLNYEDHKEFFDEYNKEITAKIDETLSHYGIEPAESRPKNKKGEPCQLGVWDFEGVYDEFKTLGAKRYMTYKDGELSITVAGVNKNAACPWLAKQFASEYRVYSEMNGKTHTFISKDAVENVFDMFNVNLYFDTEATGKLLHTYIDDEIEADIEDYNGRLSHVRELSSCHLEATTYAISEMQGFIDFINEIKSIY